MQRRHGSEAAAAPPGEGEAAAAAARAADARASFGGDGVHRALDILSIPRCVCVRVCVSTDRAVLMIETARTKGGKGPRLCDPTDPLDIFATLPHTKQRAPGAPLAADRGVGEPGVQ